MEDFGAVPAEEQEENSVKSQMSPHVMEPPPDPSDHIQTSAHNSFEHQSPGDLPEVSETHTEGQPSFSDHLVTRNEPLLLEEELVADFPEEELVANFPEDSQVQTAVDHELLDAHPSNKKQGSSLKLVLRKNIRLREKIKELHVLNTCLRTENNLKHVQNEHLRAKVARLKERQVIFFKRMHKIQRIVSRQKIRIHHLKRQNREAKLQSVPGVQLLINTP